MLKKLELAQPTSCLNKAASDELVFVLRAKDPHAPQTLRHWATMSEGFHDPAKLAEARQCADEMERWRAQRFDAEGRPHPTTEPDPAPAHTLAPAMPTPPPWRARAGAHSCAMPRCKNLNEESSSFCREHGVPLAAP